MMFFRCNGRAASALSLALALTAPAAFAQTSDGKPLRLIAPIQAGSQVDAVARAMSQGMAEAFRRPIVIENLPGSGGVTGTLQIVNAPKDGSVLGIVSSNHAINPHIYKKVPFDSLKDITPITVIGSTPVVLVVNPTQVQAKTTREFIAEVRSKAKEMTYGSAGNGTVLHLAAEYFNSEAGVSVLHIPYKGTGALVSDLVGGQVQYAMLSVPVAAPQIKAGKLRAIAVSTTSRSPALPDVPTLSESGVPGFNFDAWIAIIGPAGMPDAVVSDTYRKIKAVLERKDVHEALLAQGLNTIASTPQQFGPFLSSEMEKHGRLVKRSGATVE